MPVGPSVTLADSVISLEADTAEDIDALLRFFGKLPPTNRRADLEITIRGRSSQRVGTVATVDVPPVRQGPTVRWIEDLKLTVGHDLGAIARVDDASLTIECPPTLDDRGRAIRQLLFSALSWWFERQGRLLLHGAMIARGTEAALIVGETGAGKSTVAYAALRAGWDLCSDDLVIVDASGESPRGAGIPKPLSIDRALADPRADGAYEPLRGDDRNRVWLDDRTLATGWRTLRMILGVGHDPGAGALVPMLHDDSMDLVFGASLESERPSVVVRHLKTFVTLAGLPSYELLHATNETIRLARAAELVDQAWELAGGDQ